MISRSLMKQKTKVFWYLFLSCTYTYVYYNYRKSARLTTESTRCVIIENLFLHNACDLLEAVCVCVVRWFLTHAAVGPLSDTIILAYVPTQSSKTLSICQSVCVCVFDWRSHANFKLFSWLVMNVLGAKKAAYQCSFRRLDISYRLCASYIIIIIYIRIYFVFHKFKNIK